MRAMPSSLLLSLGLACGAGAWAQTTPSAADLAKASGCYSCHANGEKIVGPAFASIAEKYTGDKDAVASLAQSIQNGSKGKWGRIPMPPHASLSGAELKALAGWVMTVKP
jgi:cytochrome c